jgi:hypothetical protein
VAVELEAHDAVHLVAARRDDDDRHVARLGAHLKAPADLGALHVGQHQVEQDAVGPAVAREAQAVFAARREEDLVPCVLEVVIEDLEQRGLVFDDQDPCHRRPVYSPPVTERWSGRCRIAGRSRDEPAFVTEW